MKTQGKIVIMVFITINMGKAKNCLDTMEEMLVEMNERLSMAEGKLTKTEDELAATYKGCPEQSYYLPDRRSCPHQVQDCGAGEEGGHLEGSSLHPRLWLSL